MKICYTAVLWSFVLVNASLGQNNSAVSFNADIRPILSDRCFACHGPDSESRESGLRLDQADGSEGSHEFAIVPGSLEESEVWARITSDDEDEMMPPPSSHKKRLSETERSLIKRWIQSGAKYNKFWAFEIPKISPSPVVKNDHWSQQEIDLHVLRKLESVGRSPSPEAELRLLVRRVTLDLTGLPPTLEEVHKFLAACAESGTDQAWENLVDHLLAQEQFGEHIARYWLDVVRFADTNGMHKDFYRNNVAYRDWVVRSFNEDLPYDDFIRYQIAGDLYAEPTHDQLVASGFHRLHLIIDAGTALPEESFTKNVLDRVTSVGTGFMGMTVHCAQCHDHKYDPITQKDFYSLYAFFNNIDATPETVFRPKYGLQEPFVSFASPEQDEKLSGLNGQVGELDASIGELKKKIAGEEKSRQESEKPPAEGEEKPATFDDTQLKSHKQELAQLESKLKPMVRERDQLDSMIPRAMVMKERAEVRPTQILIRGQYDMPGEEVQRDTPAFLPPLKKAGDVATRMDFANWLVAPENPLTARVAVNRFWQQFFGVGLFKTSEDIGAQGEVPSHPELLDYLAVSFVESGWNVKAIVKQIVMSKTYRQSSRATPEQFKNDPENRLLARASRYRMDAEMIRDQILASSGLLSKKMYGPSVKPPQPDGLWQAVTMTGERFQPDSGDSIYRRSLYTYWKRAMPPPQMTILNAPNRDACVARRERTNSPSQALLLLNEAEYMKAARTLAQSVLQQPAEERISFAWESVTLRLPDQKETSTLQSLLDEMHAKYRAEPELASQLCAGIELASAEAKADLAAWAILINTLYNLDLTKTQE